MISRPPATVNPLLLCLSLLCATGTPTQAEPLTHEQCEADGAFAWVEAGTYIAGTTKQEQDFAYRLSASTTATTPEGIAADEADLRGNRWFDDEPPRAERTLPSTCIARVQVTNAEYQKFIRATGHRVPGISRADYQKQGFLHHPYTTVERFLWSGDAYPKDEGDHPVVLISYADAVRFAAWKGQSDGRTYRLPTADEWEKAARGTDGRLFPWGNDWRTDASNWAGSGIDHTAPVTAFATGRSPYGVGGMAGQVFEFTSTLVETPTGTKAIMKNCGWDDSPGFCRGGYRHERTVLSRHILIGFRLVRE